MADIITKENGKSLVVKETLDSRTIGQVARDVHLTNINAKERSYGDQISDRQFLQDCVACWDLLNLDNGIRRQVENILMERYWLL